MLQYREYGESGPVIVLLHGGPGAPGSMAPVAEALADSFRVLEPFQRRSGGEKLTVGRHVSDLRRFLEELGGERPALVGSSWGAMLALAYAAAYPDPVIPLVLVGCGTFDSEAREYFRLVLQQRMGESLRKRIQLLPLQISDADERLRKEADLILSTYSYDPITADQGLVWVDARGHQETWADMLRLQRGGVYPAVFRAIEGPVLMLHGSFDPHPGRMIRASIQKFLPQLEYREFERCGHYPWLERQAREEFLSVLREWLAMQLKPQTHTGQQDK